MATNSVTLATLEVLTQNEDQYFASINRSEQQRRNDSVEARRRKLEQDFDCDILPFSYCQLKRTGIRLPNLTWLQLMMKAIDHVVTNGFALSADPVAISKALSLANDVTVSMYDGPKYKCPGDLPELFFDGEIPIYQSHLNELGIFVTKQQLASVKAQAVSEQMEKEEEYHD
jgi:hypothetical protein